MIHLSPYIALDLLQEDSAYSTLLLHHPWPNGDEGSIVLPEATAVTTFQDLQEGNLLLHHVHTLLSSIKEDDAVIAEIAASAAANGQFHEQQNHPQYEQDMAGEYDSDDGTYFPLYF